MKLLRAILPLLFVYAATKFFWRVTAEPWSARGPEWIDGAVKAALWIVPSIVAVMLMRLCWWDAAKRELGLMPVEWRGAALGAVAALPMAAVLPFVGDVRVEWPAIVGSALLGPVAEEILFRGFLFRQLRRSAGWSLLGAACLSAVFFGLAHDRQFEPRIYFSVLDAIYGYDLAGRFGPGFSFTLALTTATIAAGGLVFAWLVERWDSLWPAIGLHAFINLWWELAGRGSAPAAALSIAHALSLMAAAWLTLRYAPRPATLAKKTKGPAMSPPPGPAISDQPI